MSLNVVYQIFKLQIMQILQNFLEKIKDSVYNSFCEASVTPLIKACRHCKTKQTQNTTITNNDIKLLN